MRAHEIHALRFARPYAEAAFSLSVACDAVLLWRDALALLAAIVCDDQGRRICTSPEYTPSQHAQMLWQIFTVLWAEAMGEAKEKFSSVASSPQAEGQSGDQAGDQAGDGETTRTYIHRWVSLLADRRKLSLLPVIYQSFEVQRHAHSGVQRVHITTAQALSPTQRDELVAVLSTQAKKTVSLSESVDAALLGGGG